MDGPGSAAGNSIEVEWQFDALDLRPVERWLASLPEQAAGRPSLQELTVRASPPRRLVDRYLDTDDWRVARAGLVLRVRRRGQRQEATLKDTRPASEDGLRRRLEVTEDVPPGGLAALEGRGPVGWRLAAVAGRRPLRQVLEVRTRRQPFVLRTAAGDVAEVALDDTVIAVGPGQRPARLRRVEVEVVPDWTDALGPLVDELRSAAGLNPASLSKFDAGLLAAGLAVPGPPDLGPTAVGRDASLGDLAFAVLRTHLGALLAREPGTRLGEDPEELHDMRVATRKLRAAMDLFADVLPARSTQLRQELRWIAAALGRVRDLDVQIERTEQMAAWAAQRAHQPAGAFEHLTALLDVERGAARRALLGALDSSRWERLTAGLVAMARQGPNRRLPATRTPAALVIGDLVLSRHRRAVKDARRAQETGKTADFHRVRIRCKSLRYSLEFTAPLYGRPARRFTRELAELQDSLGSLQDAEVGRARLLALATGGGGGAGPTGDGLPPATVFAMGGIAEHYRLESERRRKSVPKRLRVLTGRSWDDLASTIERRRAAAASAGGPSRLPPPTVGPVGRERRPRPAHASQAEAAPAPPGRGAEVLSTGAPGTGTASGDGPDPAPAAGAG